MTFDLKAVAPEIAAQIKAYEREMAEHREGCENPRCERCFPAPAAADRPDELRRAELERHRAVALDTVPDAYAGVTLDTPWLAPLVGPKAMELARAATPLRRAVFLGPPGSGKTTLAVALFRRHVEASTSMGVRRALYVSSHALAKARASHTLGAEAPLVERALTAPLLLLDELGGEDARYASAVAEVIYERHAQNLATWITTGVAPLVVSERYGGGIGRRVFEGATKFVLGGKR